MTKAQLAGVGFLALIAVCWYFFFSSPPQMGIDSDVFRTVDALYTAVRAKDEPRVGQCATTLSTHREAGKLPANAADYLDDIVARSRSGDWDSATRRLYDFMLAQRRDGEAKPKSGPRG